MGSGFNPFDAVTAIWRVRNQSYVSIYNVLNADLASLFLICPKRCKSYDKSLKFRWLRRDIKASAFLTWSAENFSPPSWLIFEKYLLLTE